MYIRDQAAVVFDWIFNLFFLIECFIMVLAYGLFLSPHAYLRHAK